MLQRAFAELDLAGVHRVIAALDHVVDLAAASLLRRALPEGIVENDIVGADAEFGPHCCSILEDQIFELQAQESIAAGRQARGAALDRSFVRFDTPEVKSRVVVDDADEAALRGSTRFDVPRMVAGKETCLNPTNAVMMKCDLVRFNDGQILPHQIANFRFGEARLTKAPGLRATRSPASVGGKRLFSGTGRDRSAPLKRRALSGVPLNTTATSCHGIT